MSTSINVRQSTMAQLLAFFNANTGGNVVAKFRDRVTAEKRVQKLVDEMKAEELVKELDIRDQKEAAHIIAKQLGASAVLLDEVDGGDEEADVGYGDKQEEEERNQAALKARNARPLAEKLVERSLCSNVDRDSTKPWQRAKVIICDMAEAGNTNRKDIIAACVAAGIKYNTADGAHYEMCVKGRAK